MHIHTSPQPALDLGFRSYSCNWGTHICGLYESEAEREQIVYGYLHAGDLAGDLQAYVPCEHTPQHFNSRYSDLFPEQAGHLADVTCFRLLSARDLYYPSGIFSPWDMDRGLQAFFDESQAAGPRNVRALAEMVWALEAIPGIEHLMAYEARLNYFIPGKSWVSICLYNVNRFSGKIIMNVLRTHPFTISGGVITQNPYYQKPDEWLAENAPEFMNPAPG